MSVVTTHRCDICDAKSDARLHYWGTYTDVNGAVYEVCNDCHARLMQPLLEPKENVSGTTPAAV